MMAGLSDGVVSDIGNIVNLLLAVEDCCSFLEGLALCFDEEEEDVDQFKGEEG